MFNLRMKMLVLVVVLPMLVSACKGAAPGGDTSVPESLANMALSVGTLVPSFRPSVTDYSASVPYSVSQLQLITAINRDSSLSVNSKVTKSDVHTIYLAVGTQTVTLDVTYGTVADPQTKTYSIRITRAAMPTDLNLSSLTVDSGTLSPAFSASTSGYAVSVPYSISSISLTPTAVDSGVELTVNGAVVGSGHASGAIALNIGSNVINVISSNGATGIDLATKTYTITVSRAAPSANTSLSALTLSSGSLSPSFTGGTLTYTATVGYSTTAISLTATTSDDHADLEINGVTEVSNQPSASIPLSVGSNSIPISVLAQDGVSARSYTVTVTRSAASNNADLSSLALTSGTLSPAFSSNTVTYTASVAYVVDSIQFVPTAADAAATLTINGASETPDQASSAYSLNVGANVFTLSLLAENQTTAKTYTVTITRTGPSTNNSLNSLTILPGIMTPIFNANVLSYTILLSDAATDLTFTPTSSDGTATIEASWNLSGYFQVDSASASPQLVPNVGNNTLEIRVTSQSGSARTYTLTVIYDICGPGYYDPGNKSCMQAGLGFFSADADDGRTACTNKPANARYTSATAETADCPWSCNNGYITNDGVSCTSYPTATSLACNDDEVAVGLYGLSGVIVDKIGVRCAQIVNGVVSTTIRNGPAIGGTTGGSFSMDCSGDSVALEIDGDNASYAGGTHIGRVRYRCLDTVSQQASTSWNPASTYWGSSTGMGAFNFQCGSGANPFGRHMNGLIIDSAGGLFTGALLGISCR